MSNLSRTAQDEQVSDGDLHGLAILIHSRGSDFDQSEFWTRLRWSHREHFTGDPQLIAWPHWLRPAKLIEAGSDDPASGLELALDQ
jgi:hypothetical protein